MNKLMLRGAFFPPIPPCVSRSLRRRGTHGKDVADGWRPRLGSVPLFCDSLALWVAGLEERDEEKEEGGEGRKN